MGIFQGQEPFAMYWQHYEHCDRGFEPCQQAGSPNLPSAPSCEQVLNQHESNGNSPIFKEEPISAKLTDCRSHTPSDTCSAKSDSSGDFGAMGCPKGPMFIKSEGVNTNNSETVGTKVPDGGGNYQEMETPRMKSSSVEGGAAVCHGCGKKILDRYYLMALDSPWHGSCLRCAECKLPLESELSCFARDGSIFCKEDYTRLFTIKRCARCQAGIAANEMVFHAREFVFHVQCFTCSMCGLALSKGDHFGMRDNVIYCRTHYEMLMMGHDPGTPSPGPPLPMPPMPIGPMGMPGITPCEPMFCYPTPPPAPGDPMNPNKMFFNGVGGTQQKGRPRKSRKNKDVDGLTDMGGFDMDSGYGGGGSSSTPRPKRVRTSFKHHQLRTMKSYFSINHNPDAKDLKQLSQKTGLSKRVLQVWFQNARAKWRRSMLRQTGQDPQKAGEGACLADLANSPEPSHSLSPDDMGGSVSAASVEEQDPCVYSNLF